MRRRKKKEWSLAGERGERREEKKKEGDESIHWIHWIWMKNKVGWGYREVLNFILAEGWELYLGTVVYFLWHGMALCGFVFCLFLEFFVFFHSS